MIYETYETETGANQSNALALIDHNGDGFAAAAAEADQHLIRGQIVKFTDGLWTLNKQPIAKDARFVPVQLKMAWVRWENQRPVEYIWPKPNGLLPARESLSHLEESDWPAELDGKPKDPWQNTRFVYLTDLKTASTHTLTNSTAGVRVAYSELAQAVTTMRRSHPGALPVVELSSLPMKTKVGTKLRPQFQIVDWKVGASNHAVQQQIRAPKAQIIDDGMPPFEDVPFNDDVPF